MTYRRNSSSVRHRLVTAAVGALLLCGWLLPATASASPQSELEVFTELPDHVVPGKFMRSVVAVENSSNHPLSGDLIIKYTFPAETPFLFADHLDPSASFECQTAASVTECVNHVEGYPPGRVLSQFAFNSVDPIASGEFSGQVEVSGGGTGEHITIPISMTADPIGPFAVKSLDVGLIDGPAFPALQAGGHPAAVSNDFTLLSQARAPLGEPQFTLIATPENFRNIVAHVPAGVVGYTSSLPALCTPGQLDEQPTSVQAPACPQDSQVGFVQLNGGRIAQLYAMVPSAGAPAEFGFQYQGVAVLLKARVRPSDSGIDIVSRPPTAVPIPRFRTTFWGVPADSSHDPLRPQCTLSDQWGNNGGECSTEAPRTPFLRMPTSCTGPLPWGIEMDTDENPGVFHSRETSSPGMEGCANVPFSPSFSLASSSRAAHETSGLDVTLSIPQGSTPNGLDQSDLKQVDLALPQGISINPASADGLAPCTDVQLRLGLEGPTECPESSKIGTLELRTPLLTEPIGGSVYLRTQASKDPASGEMYRLAIVLHSAERGVDVKLPGSLVADPQTGQLTTRFTDLPQLPFESMQLHLKSGPRAPLTTPSSCGTYTTHAELTPWARPEESVPLDSSFTIDQGCSAPGFAPGFEAGVTNPTAGGFSPFTLRVTRDSGQPNLSRIDATLPEGELAKLAGVPLCPDAAAATGACPASSQIGTTTVGVGEGSSPLYVPQAGHSPTAVYLAGPYKGGPYSIVVKVPAQAGPFDLGTVTVRSALHVDPVTTRASVLSDPLPQIFGGIPVSYRDVRVQVDRPEFTVNPTSCEPQSVDGTIGSANGQSANVSDRFQVHDCAALGFKPKLTLRLRGGVQRGDTPALTATLRMPKGANIARTSVALPHSEFLDQAHIRTVCTRVQFAAGGGGGEGCPAGSIYGRATATSPLLDQPLSGPVYLRSSNNPLPDMVIALDGQIHVDIVARIDSKNGGIRATFAKVPDAPVSKFVLTMQGGKKGLIQNSRNLCGSTRRADAQFDGQNGKSSDFKPLVKPTSCADNARRKHRRG
jgi:hypothetical protein